jgi:hypothetical protein
LKANRYLGAVLEQKGVDLVVRLPDAAGKKLSAG